MSETAALSAPRPQQENLLVNLVCTIALPTLVLTKFSTPERLGPKLGLIVALAFPLAYGVYDLVRRRNFNFIAALGFVSTLATGGLGLLKLAPFWFAVKEAVVPSLIGLTVLGSQWAGRPVVRAMLLNDQVINLPRVNAALDERGARAGFDALLVTSSWLLAGSFALSAALNFGLARVLITTMPDTPEFNVQLGRMTLWSWPVIALPVMAITLFALWRLVKGVMRLTGLTLEEILHAPPEKK